MVVMVGGRMNDACPSHPVGQSFHLQRPILRPGRLPSPFLFRTAKHRNPSRRGIIIVIVIVARFLISGRVVTIIVRRHRSTGFVTHVDASCLCRLGGDSQVKDLREEGCLGLQENDSLFLSAFPIFVPSLSW
jgi:hypothetical protein